MLRFTVFNRKIFLFMQVGFSTASFFKFMPMVSKEAIRFCRDLGCEVIQIGADSIKKVENFKEISKQDLKDFEKVYLHGPGKNLDNLNSADKKKLLNIYEEIYQRIGFDYLLFHPGRSIMRKNFFKGYTFPIAVENMDWRNKFGINVADMRKILASGNFKMVLDLNHAYTHNKDLKLAKDFHDNFKEKIVYYHASDFGGNYQTDHVPFFKFKHDEILKAMPDLDLPIILEVILENKEEAGRELEYVRKVISLPVGRQGHKQRYGSSRLK